jgi:hypothetical protein
MSSRQRKPTNLTLRWWSGTAGCAMKGRKGNRDRRPCSPTAECQTNLGLPVNSVSFLAQPAERRKAGRFHGYCCGLAPGEASRCYCLAFGDRRSLAPYWQAEPAPTGPRATTRGILLLAGRSLAAILLLGRYAEHRGLPASRSRLLRIKANPQRSQGSPARAAKRRGAGWTGLLSGLASARNGSHCSRVRTDFLLAVSTDCGRAQGRSRNGACEMKRAGLEPAANCRVSHRARAEPCRQLGAKRACEQRKCQLGEAGLNCH